MDKTGNESPPVAAVFLVVFDQKVGYTIAWKRSLPDVDLDGVEYSSLPSGLHAIKEDLVYFIHGSHAGISAFVQGEADVKHRNANFVAVGVLVPLSYGQLGRGWMHAQALRDLAKEIVQNANDTRLLELFWKKNRSDETSKQPPPSPTTARDETGGRKRKRAMSEATVAGFNAQAAWPHDHPAFSTTTYLETFGPLIFPLQRAALLRKRILFLGTPPVQRQGNTVYIASVLSNISRSFGETLPAETEPLLHGHPLFSVGVKDLPLLGDKNSDSGWLACSTDDVLGEKKKIFDVLVVLPSWQTGSGRLWPKITTSDGKEIKATQRDLRKWNLLRRELRRLKGHSEDTATAEQNSTAEAGEPDDEERPLLSAQPQHDNSATSGLRRRDESEVIEPSSWSALAYRGFMWWASAGEAQAWENDELKADEELFFDIPDLAGVLSDGESARNREAQEAHYSRAVATLTVAYFRRVTEQLLRTLTRIVEEADDSTEEGIEEDQIEINVDDMREMGLDAWSVADKAFAVEMMKKWFARESLVVDSGVRICGLQVC